jgi:hypothetical protein
MPALPDDVEEFLEHRPALPDDVLARLEVISTQLEGVATRITDVAEVNRKENQRTWRFTIGLCASLGLDLVLTVVVTVLSLAALHANATLHSSQLTACAIGNQTRAQQRVLWQHLVAESKTPPTAEIKSFLDFVNKTFAPVSCSDVYKN